jgi:hypothetical protein
MGWIMKGVTPAVVIANRANGKKSTGPKTTVGKRRVSRNAGKYFVFGQITSERLRELGEDPAEFEKLRQSLLNASEPRDGFEEILVDEIAVNRWRLARLRSAEGGMLIKLREIVRPKLKDPSVAANSGPENSMIRSRGLAGATDSPHKFSQMLTLLKLLYYKVKNEGFTEQGMTILREVYGDPPLSKGGIVLIQLFVAHLVKSESIEGGDSNARSAANEVIATGEEIRARRKFLEYLGFEINATRGDLDMRIVLTAEPTPPLLSDALLMLPEEVL